CVAGQRIEHEEADEPVRVQPDCLRDRVFVTGDAGNERPAGDTVPVELVHPCLRERFGAAGVRPAKPGGDHGGAARLGPARQGLAQHLEKRGREEVAVNVVEHQPANLYPIPWTVRMNCGCRGFGSTFWRSQATCTSTVRVDGMAL